MARGRHSRRKPLWRTGSVPVGLVAALAGLLFATNAQSAASSDLRDAPGLRGMATARNRQVENLEAQRAKLFDEVTDLLANAGSGPDEADPAIGLAAGTVAVTGAGLTVRLDDSQADSAILPDSPSNPAERLVHQQDIDAVMNALWRGGAEAMSVQGHRVVSNTVVKCVGNVILVAGRVYSPPYSISAIGPPEVMRQALASAPMVVAYRDRATRLGLTWEVSGENDLTMMANLPGPPRLRYAQTTAARLDGVRP